jgi:hypothetical protein
LPIGVPGPEVPRLELLGDVFGGSAIIAIVAYTTSFSMAKILALKQNYEVDANQELLAQGLGNVAGSFFKSGPMAASLSRSLIQQAVGGVTQVANVVSCLVLLVIFLFIGPLFEPLPNVSNTIHKTSIVNSTSSHLRKIYMSNQFHLNSNFVTRILFHSFFNPLRTSSGPHPLVTHAYSYDLAFGFFFFFFFFFQESKAQKRNFYNSRQEHSNAGLLFLPAFLQGPNTCYQ